MTPEQGKLPKSIKMTQAYWDKLTNSTFVLKKQPSEAEKQLGYISDFQGLYVKIDNDLDKDFEFEYADEE